MRKLLNTVYVTNEMAYLTLDGENLVCKIDGETKLRIPFENIENIVCFNYIGCSPALMGKCVSKTIPINFISPQGKFLAKVCGETKGNVFLRVAQIDTFRESGLILAQNTMAAKFSNTRQLLRRTLHDNADLREDEEVKNTIEILTAGIEKVYSAKSVEEIIGIEGYCAQSYFSVFNKRNAFVCVYTGYERICSGIGNGRTGQLYWLLPCAAERAGFSCLRYGRGSPLHCGAFCSYSVESADNWREGFRKAAFRCHMVK